MDLVSVSGWFSFLVVLLMFFVDRIFRARRYYQRGYMDGYANKKTEIEHKAKMTLLRHDAKRP